MVPTTIDSVGPTVVDLNLNATPREQNLGSDTGTFVRRFVSARDETQDNNGFLVLHVGMERKATNYTSDNNSLISNKTYCRSALKSHGVPKPSEKSSHFHTRPSRRRTQITQKHQFAPPKSQTSPCWSRQPEMTRPRRKSLEIGCLRVRQSSSSEQAQFRNLGATSTRDKSDRRCRKGAP